MTKIMTLKTQDPLKSQDNKCTLSPTRIYLNIGSVLNRRKDKDGFPCRKKKRKRGIGLGRK